MKNKHRVVITGIGLVTPVGNDTKSSWHSLIEGKSGIIKFQSDLDLGRCARVAGQVIGVQELIDSVLTKQEQRKTGRFIQLSVVAAKEAIADAGVMDANKTRFGAFIGVGVGGVEMIEQGVVDYTNRGPKAISPFLLPSVISNEAPGWMSIKFGLQGPTMAVVNACSSGNDAIGHAFHAVQDGYADYMLAGGAESCLTPLSLVGFGNMRALSTWQGDPTGASRPFSVDRSGFVMGEGAGILLLEREDLARKRGAKIYAEIVGYGVTSDAYHITAIHPEGEGGVRAIRCALAEARVSRDQVGYVNAHGTATPMNDGVETKMLKTVFGDHVNPATANHAVVSSTKSMTGHMLGAAGGAEVAFTALALKNQLVPPTINLENPDPACDLDYIPNQAREILLSHAISNSFGFGGANSVIVLKRYY